MVRFNVIDTGIGLSSEQQKLIFEPFRQADGSVTRRYGGTGLGLAICSNLAELMGGGITGAKRAGRGKHVFIHHRLSGLRSGRPMWLRKAERGCETARALGRLRSCWPKTIA